MTSMTLKFNEICNSYTLTDSEAKRLTLALDNGETLSFLDGKKSITLAGGVLTLLGFGRVPRIFSSPTPIGVPNTDSEAVMELKKRIEKVIVGEGATSVGDEVFRNYINLTELHLPDTVTYLDNPCPQSLKLSPYPLPKSIRSIHGRIYPTTPERVTLPEGLEKMWKVFIGTDIKSVYIPSSIKEISMFSFRECHSLEEVVISEGVEVIENSAFSGCTSLRSVKIPESVKMIKGSAFAGCSSLSSVQIHEGCYVFDNAFFATPYFRTKNAGRVSSLPRLPYEGDTAKIPALKEARKKLEGLTAQDQAKHLTVHVRSREASYSYGRLEDESSRDTKTLLYEDIETEKLVTLDGLVVGIVINGKQILVGEDKCTYYASEDDGPGRRSVEKYYGLLLEE